MTNIPPEVIETLEDPDCHKAVSFEILAEIAAALGLELRVDIRLEKTTAATHHDHAEGTGQKLPLAANSAN